MKYKRCCIERDAPELQGRPDTSTTTDPPDTERMLEQDASDAIVENLRILIARDKAALNRGLIGFADLLESHDLLATVRFPARDFAAAVDHSLRRLGTRATISRARLFRNAVTKLAHRGTVRKLRDLLARAMIAPDLDRSERDAVAAALICLMPVLDQRALPANQSPTLEIIFNIQLARWPERRGPSACSPRPDQ